MSRTKSERCGEIRHNIQGLRMQIVKYTNNKNIEVLFLDTGETVKTRYDLFKKGYVTADFFSHPVGYDVNFGTAKFLGGAVVLFILSAIAVLSYMILR